MIIIILFSENFGREILVFLVQVFSLCRACRRVIFQNQLPYLLSQFPWEPCLDLVRTHFILQRVQRIYRMIQKYAPIVTLCASIMMAGKRQVIMQMQLVMAAIPLLISLQSILVRRITVSGILRVLLFMTTTNRFEFVNPTEKFF